MSAVNPETSYLPANEPVLLATDVGFSRRRLTVLMPVNADKCTTMSPERIRILILLFTDCPGPLLTDGRDTGHCGAY